MRSFLDTSVLVAANEDTHPNYAPSLDLLSRAEKGAWFCAAHTLAETYAVLTRLPVRPRILPEQALLFLADVHERITPIALTELEYMQTLHSAASTGIAGGQIYDALLLKCAVRAEADIIYTWNVRHFQRIAPDLAERVRTP